MISSSRMSLERDGPIAALTLLRPDRGNAIDLAFGAELLAAAIEIAASPISVVIIKSSGAHFCFGGDLKEMAEATPQARQAHLLKLTSYIHTAVSHLASAPCAIVTAAVGASAGAGFGLVLASDLVIGGRSSTFIPAFSAVGLTPDTAVSFYLPRVVGRRRAAELLLTNRSLNADEAVAWGILNQVVADTDVIAQAETLARRIAEGPRQALAMTKRLLSSSLAGLENHLAKESAAIALQGTSPGAEEGIQAFLAKRRPRFTSGGSAADR